MGDFNSVYDFGSKDNFVANEGNATLDVQAFTNQNWLMDREEVKGFQSPKELHTKKDFELKERQVMLSSYSTFDSYYNPATQLYNKSMGFV